jgi:tetratricopeptide (TPR) repeat protein
MDNGRGSAVRLPGLARVRSLALVALLLGGIQAAAADPCAPVLARVVSVQGDVQLTRATTTSRAELDSPLCAGDQVRVPPRGRAAVALKNETVVRLDQGTTLTLGIPTEENISPLGVCSGALYVITRTPRQFKINTPFVNASVKGTEFLVEVESAAPPQRCVVDTSGLLRTALRDESARVSVLEGTVAVQNALGDVSPDPTSGQLATDRSRSPLISVRPRDAVTWTLYVPTILDDQLGLEDAASPAEPSQRGDPYRSMRVADGLAALEQAPNKDEVAVRTRRAGLLLLVGRLDEAKALIRAVLAADGDKGTPGTSDARALAAVIALAENDKDEAEKQANEALRANPDSAVAWLALSYAQQARFKIEDALASVRKAVQLAPQRPLTLARLAELDMATGAITESRAAATQAARIAPQLAKVQVVLGFSELLQFDTRAAKRAFEQAIELDHSDPLARLGMGLARIREGDLARGREEIEVAVALDPGSSLLRSYLGKAFFEERRGQLAAAQYSLAKALDPLDPTPWLYDALSKGADNRSVEAVEDLIESIRLNGTRAVYRSQLLLDEDLAARSTSLARSFLELDLPEAALAHAATSLALDPGNSSAHRFLSDVSTGQQRHEITRASELLQAQLRQPLSVTPLQAQLANDRLFSTASSGPSSLGFNEFGSLFLANGANAQIRGVLGSNRTSGEQALISLVHESIGLGVSELHFTTQGGRPNADSNENAQSAFVQASVSPQTSAQFELTWQRHAYGDIVSRFDPNTAFTSDRNTDRSQDTRLGLRHSLSPASDLLFALNRRDDRSSTDFGGGLTIGVETKSTRAEFQHTLRGSGFSLVSGLSYLTGSTREDVFGEVVDSVPRHLNAYAYSTHVLTPRTYLELGASFDHLRTRDSGNERQINPKLGLIWHPATETTVRGAVFRVLKRRINADAALEPTQVAGFEQFFDDANGTKSWGSAVAADFRPLDALRTGVSISGRKLDVPTRQADDSILFDKWREREAGAYVHWTFDRVATLALRLRHTRYQRAPLATGDEGFEFVETTEAPVSLKLFGPDRFWSSLVVTHVRQHGRFTDPNLDLVDGSDRFQVIDLAIGYRLPQRRGDAALECSNLLGKSFHFQDIGLEGARFAPQRTCRFRVSLDL